MGYFFAVLEAYINNVMYAMAKINVIDQGYEKPGRNGELPDVTTSRINMRVNPILLQL